MSEYDGGYGHDDHYTHDQYGQGDQYTHGEHDASPWQDAHSLLTDTHFGEFPDFHDLPSSESGHNPEPHGHEQHDPEHYEPKPAGLEWEGHGQSTDAHGDYEGSDHDGHREGWADNTKPAA